MMKQIHEHLKTVKKYNTLELHCNCLKEDLQKLTIELNNEKLTNQKLKEKFNKEIEECINEIVKLKLKLKEKKGVKNDSKRLEGK